MTAVLAIDSSVLVAILKQEPERDDFLKLIDVSHCVIGWPTVLETRLWIVRKSALESSGWFDNFLKAPGTVTVDFSEQLEGIAHSALLAFGKGRHPAKLNYGDCMAYAVAKHHDVPLLFKGADFGKTDVKIHPASIMED